MTEKIHCTSPVVWRQFDGLLAAYWQARGDAAGHGYYLSANPRLTIFFDDVSSIEVDAPRAGRPMARAIFVPAGLPLRTSFTQPLAFSHLDIHLDTGWALRLLSRAMPRAAAIERLDRTVARDDIGDLEAIARLMVDEIRRPARHDIYAESLAAALVSALLVTGAPDSDPGNARLTAAQLRRVEARFEAGGGRRRTTAQLAEAVGLSESWFAQVFRNTTGQSPHQWQQARRIDMTRRMLTDTTLSVAEIADRLGFADQSHLTKAFRQTVGATPAAWRRANRAGAMRPAR
ncbi:helix-turn-helix transcriptional regulator [Oceanicola sp. 22II-s10i]|uniref:helix-turn-helix transcriptional regulator n=1 Tax=Oceanicola sp. 22II-s10i TaxID=1317116 RepID=UPI001C3E4D1A|nr:helix-turn-helix transcriptional regulator [Oceanicola sp. 22II-s10i]